ncbi:MAG: DUF5063 domain-containing protein [Dehalococcoidales bacterium]|nr:DUF5063 domain-containing protein [Dehalococcoidales bacterium]
MTKRISETDAVKDFIDIADKFCSLVENREQLTDIKLLQQAFVILPELCVRASKLPEVVKTTLYRPSVMSSQESLPIMKALAKIIDGHDRYHETTEPWDENDKEVVSMCLSDDFTEIYENLKPSLRDWDKVTPAQRLDIIWEWKFVFGAHWGEHAVIAFRALFMLLYQRLEDSDGDYIGLRNI